MNVGRNGKKHRYAIGPPSYRLRSDVGVLHEHLLLLFLRKCGIAEEHVTRFLNCVKYENLHRK